MKGKNMSKRILYSAPYAGATRRVAPIFCPLLTAFCFLFTLSSSSFAADYRWLTVSTKEGLSSEIVYALGVQKDEVWFGTVGGGATLYHKATGKTKVYTTKGEKPQPVDDGDTLNWKNLPAYNDVTCIAVDGEKVWFGTDFYGYGGGGVSCYDPRKNTWTNYNNSQHRLPGKVILGLVYKKPVSLAVDGQYLWIGTTKGLSRLDKQKNQFKNFKAETTSGLAGDYINSIAVTSEAVWLATNGGVSRYDKNTGKFTRYTPAWTQDSKECKTVAVGEKEVWAGGTYGGLCRFNASLSRFEPAPAGDPLEKEAVQHILAVKDKIYFCKDGGLSLWDQKSRKWAAITSKDGLPGDKVFCAAQDSDGIWLGTDKGAAKLMLQ